MNLFVFWTESFGDALKVANQLASTGGHLLDCSIIGKWSQVMVHFENLTSEVDLSKITSRSAYKKAWLPNIKNQIVESYLSLSTTKVSDFLLSVETPFIGDVFEFLQGIDLTLFPIVDLRLLRFNDPKSLLLLTGKQGDGDELMVIIENFKARGKIGFKSDEMVIEMIHPVLTPIKDLFHYSENS